MDIIVFRLESNLTKMVDLLAHSILDQVIRHEFAHDKLPINYPGVTGGRISATFRPFVTGLG